MPRPTLLEDLHSLKGVVSVHIETGYGWFEAVIDGGNDFDIAATILKHTSEHIETRGDVECKAPVTKPAQVLPPRELSAESLMGWFTNPEIEKVPTGTKILVAVRFSRPPKPPTVIEVTRSWYSEIVSKIFVVLTELHPWFKG